VEALEVIVELITIKQEGNLLDLAGHQVHLFLIWFLLLLAVKY
jgi:hypothetical protein